MQALAAEPLAERLVQAQLRAQHLQRDGPVEHELARLVDDAHPAAAEDPLDPVVADLGPDVDPHDQPLPTSTPPPLPPPLGGRGCVAGGDGVGAGDGDGDGDGVTGGVVATGGVRVGGDGVGRGRRGAGRSPGITDVLASAPTGAFASFAGSGVTTA